MMKNISKILGGIEIGTEATRTGIIETAKKDGIYLTHEKKYYKVGSH